MELHKLSVEKTARVFTHGNPDAPEVWILLHGYGMLASQMITAFEDIVSDHLFFIAPEGLSRFYWKGFDGPVVASWMTKEDRQDEIDDYIKYLNQLIDTYQLNTKKINVLGFSQGVATMSRWLSNNNLKLNKCVFWAGEPPADIDYVNVFKRIDQAYFIYGKNDLFISETQLSKITKLFKPLLNQLEIIPFEGKHELNKELLVNLITSNNSL